MSYKIKEISKLAGVSVRTLHHYDQLGLLKPDSISTNGYRIYSEQNLLRLQQILFFKELDFSLAEIKKILDHPDFNQIHALQNQQAILVKKRTRLEQIIKLITQTINSIQGGTIMEKKEMFQAFDLTEIEKHQQKYAAEVREKYGNSPAYQESQQKTAKYSQADWEKFMDEAGEIYARLAELMELPASHPEVQAAINAWREHITQNYYQCTLEIFRGLGELYVSDPRFTKNIDQYRPGLAEFMHQAMLYYCEQQSE